MKTLQDIKVDHKIVLVRVDFNVPVNAAGQVTDPSRISAAKPTIDYLRQHQAKVVLMAHFGRPNGQVNEDMRFKAIIPTLSTVLGVKVEYVSDSIGDTVNRQIMPFLWVES
jgi:phosphoglycerate kinase